MKGGGGPEMSDSRLTDQLWFVDIMVPDLQKKIERRFVTNIHRNLTE